MGKSPYKIRNGLFIIQAERPQDKVRNELIFRLEKKGNRLYDDGEVREFPKTFAYNLHQEKWQETTAIIEKFESYLGRHFIPNEDGPFQVLVISSGNGWLANRLANRTGFQVMALEDRYWLAEQAARVFYQPNLKFLVGNITRQPFAPDTFDLIILHDGMHLYANGDELLESCLNCLKKNGQVHLLENKIFPSNKWEAAQAEYSTALEEMDCKDASPYIHLHNEDLLKAYSHTLLSRSPRLSFGRKPALTSARAFEWVRILPG